MLDWWKRFGGPAILNDYAYGVAADSNDQIVVVGYKGIAATDTDRTYRLHAAGYTVRWRYIPEAITPMNRVLIATR